MDSGAFLASIVVVLAFSYVPVETLGSCKLGEFMEMGAVRA